MGTLHFILLASVLATGSGPAPAPAPAKVAAPARDPKRASQFYQRALQSLEQRNAQVAVRHLRSCLVADPTDCRCIRKLGVTYGDLLQDTRRSIAYLREYVDTCPKAADAEEIHRMLGKRPPLTPEGLDACTESLVPARPMPQRVGEAIRYHVSINGLSVGQVDFRTERTGPFQNQPVVEYRSAFHIDRLVSTFIPVKGRAAALVPTTSFIPARAMNDLEVRDIHVREEIRFEKEGLHLTSDHTRNDQRKTRHRRYPTPSVDLLTAFYGLRALEREAKGCATFFGAGRAHTVWVAPQGQETIKTVAGTQTADRYLLRYATEVSKKPYEAQVWLSQDRSRLPLLALLDGPDRVEIRVHLYESGKPDGVY